MTTVDFEKGLSLKALAYLAKRWLDSVEVLNLRKISIIYKWKEEVQNYIQVKGEKFKLRNLPWSDFLFVVFCCELGQRTSYVCSNWQRPRSKM